jgi:NADPH:quinone reductase-like Zn-dependent oxidoreductase
MMKAVVVEKHGGPEVLEIKEVPKPSIEPGEVRDHPQINGRSVPLDLWTAHEQGCSTCPSHVPLTSQDSP